MINKNYIFFFWLLFSGSLIAQENWSLDDCVAYAIEHNLQLKEFKYNADSGKETYRQSVRNLLPGLSGSSDYNIRFGRSIDPNNNDIVNTEFFSNNYSLDASVDLFQGFQKLNAIRASKFLYKASMEDVLQQKYLLAFRVMSAFYNIRFFEGLKAISDEQVAISQANYNLVKKQIELGLMAGADLYEAESSLLTDKLAATQNENQLAAARLSLAQEMNLEDVDNISLRTTLDEVAQEAQPMDVDSVYNTAKGFIPLIKAEQLRVQAAQKNLAVSRGRLYPSLSVFAGFGTGYFETNVDDFGEVIPYRTQISDNISKIVGISLTVPISSGWSLRSGIKQQKIAQLRAKNNLDIQEQELYQLIQQLVQENKALIVEYEQGIQRVAAQDLAFSIAQKRYEKGLINALDLNTAKNLAANAKNENLLVSIRLKVNESTLAFYRGLPIFNIN
ncbi:TolC family protein [Spongiimicrobium sp. 3-5]|uniref:TolC family protein n=1 Tax=Spongiimicrobium sp. 3-5 TaxID=3332596 RepID=UPI00397F2893